MIEKIFSNLSRWRNLDMPLRILDKLLRREFDNGKGNMGQKLWENVRCKRR